MFALCVSMVRGLIKSLHGIQRTSVKGRTRLHPFANKQLKSLLNTAAMSVIQQKREYKTYFQRRTDEGKNKMSTLNIIRNKLVTRAYAVVKPQTPYVD